MSQEKLIMCSNGSGGFRSSSKKIKQNKVPQRGLGVEKLERIRLEEQRKNDTMPSAGTAESSPPAVAVPVRPPPHLYPSLPSIPLPSHQTQNIYAHHHTSPTPAFGWAPRSLDSSTCNSEKYTKVETGLFDGSSLHIPTDLKTNWPPLVLTQWRHTQPQFSSLIDTMTTSSTSTSSAVNFQIEPPSNQNAYGNCSSYMHHFYQEDKMIGMKRSWPFSLDSLSDSSFPCNATSPFSPYGGSDELFASRNSIARDGPSGSSSQHINLKEIACELNPRKRNKEDGTLDGGFLSLGLPASTKFKQPFTFPLPDYQELSKIDVLPFQGSMEDRVKHSRGLIHQQYSFLPLMEQHIGQTTNNSKSEVSNSVDLTLRL